MAVQELIQQFPSFEAIQIESLPTIAGIDRKTIYSPTDLGRIFSQQKNIALENKAQHPYFLYTHEEESLLAINQPLGQGVTLKAGPIGAFNQEDIALLIQEQTTNYVLRQTMGENFPLYEPAAVNELFSIMIDGFDQNRIVVLFEYNDKSGNRNIISGVQAHFGNSEKPLASTACIGAQGESSLATFQSVKLGQQTINSTDFARYVHIPEKNIVCMSRLFSQGREVSKTLDYKFPSLPWIGMAALGVAIQHHALVNKEAIPAPIIAVYDTHNGKIQSELTSRFGMQLSAKEGSPQVTQEVMNTILKYHYGPQSMGGYAEELVTGFVRMDQYYNMSIDQLSENGIRI